MHPSVFDTMLKEFPGPSPWNWVPEHGVKKKLQWWGYRARKKFDDIFSHLDTINTDVTRRTPPTL